jgi:hypothetical protein
MKTGTWGRDDLMVIAAFRYCLGRSTYIVGDCVDWLIDVWGGLQCGAQAVIRRELAEEFERDGAHRQRGTGGNYPLGHDCDRAEWKRLLDFING